MKKLYKRVITYILIFILSVICVKPMNVFAYGGFFTSDSFSKTGTWTDSNNVSHAAYVMQDDSSLQTGFRYYMRVGDGVAIACDGGEVIANILNYKIGLVMSANILSNFITSYIQDTSLLGREPTFYDNHPPVLKGGALVGVALNELTGCKMAYAEDSDTVNIPSDVANDVYNYYVNVYLIENPETPDYINIGSITKAAAIQAGESDTVDLNYFDNPLGSINACYDIGSKVWKLGFGSSATRSNQVSYLTGDSYYLVANYGFDETVNCYNLTKDNINVTLDDMIACTTQHYLNVNAYSISDNTVISHTNYTVTNSSSSSDNYYFWIEHNNGGNTKMIPFLNGKDYVTVYKNANIITQITNNVYAPNSYQTNNYKNYSTSNDNSYTSNVQNINNSSSNNTNIYNQAKTETNETIVEDSYNVNTTTTTTNITNITNNYYGDNGSGGSGGGDDDGGDDDDDDTIWKALLKAIGDFLKKIGELIATILTGIISIMTSVVNAISQITTSFTAVTNFLGSVFGFLPSDLVAVITLGVTLGILISLIKMFGK